MHCQEGGAGEWEGTGGIGVGAGDWFGGGDTEDGQLGGMRNAWGALRRQHRGFRLET